MGSVTLTGKDTIILSDVTQDRVINDMADGDTASLDHPNDLVSVKTGKNNNTIYSYNATGLNGELVIRVIQGSEDDKWLNQRLNTYIQDPAAFPVLTGEFIKRLGDGTGASGIRNVTYRMSGGVISKLPQMKENQEGDTEQAVVIYTIKFANDQRSIG